MVFKKERLPSGIHEVGDQYLLGQGPVWGGFQAPIKTKFDRIRDIINAIRRGEIEVGETGEVGSLTPVGMQAFIETNETLQEAGQPLATIEEFTADVKDPNNVQYSDSERKSYIVQKAKKAPRVIQEVTSSQARILVEEIVADITAELDVTDDEIWQIGNLVVDNLYSDVVIDPITGKYYLLEVPFGEAFPNLPPEISLELRRRSEGVTVDPIRILEAHWLGAAIRVASETIDPNTGKTILSDLEVAIAKGMIDDWDGDIDDLTKTEQDVRNWLIGIEGLVSESVSGIIGSGKNIYKGLQGIFAGEVGLAPLDEERRVFSPGFSPSEQRVLEFSNKYTQAFSDPKATTFSQLESLLGLYGIDIRTGADRDKDLNKAIKQVKNPFLYDLAKRIDKDKLNPNMTSEAIIEKYMPEILDFVSAYNENVATAEKEIKIAPETTTLGHNKFVKDALYYSQDEDGNAIGINIDDWPESLRDEIRKSLANMPKDKVTEYILQNRNVWMVRAQTERDWSAWIKENYPKSQVAFTPEAKAEYDKWFAGFLQEMQTIQADLQTEVTEDIDGEIVQVPLSIAEQHERRFRRIEAAIQDHGGKLPGRLSKAEELKATTVSSLDDARNKLKDWYRTNIYAKDMIGETPPNEIPNAVWDIFADIVLTQGSLTDEFAESIFRKRPSPESLESWKYGEDDPEFDDDLSMYGFTIAPDTSPFTEARRAHALSGPVAMKRGEDRWKDFKKRNLIEDGTIHPSDALAMQSFFSKLGDVSDDDAISMYRGFREDKSFTDAFKGFGVDPDTARAVAKGTLPEGRGLTPSGVLGILPTESKVVQDPVTKEWIRTEEQVDPLTREESLRNLGIQRGSMVPTHPLLSSEPLPFTAEQLIGDAQGRNWALADEERARARAQLEFDYSRAEDRRKAALDRGFSEATVAPLLPREEDGSIPGQYSYLPTRIAPPEDSKDVGDTWVYGPKPWSYVDQVRQEREQFAANQPVPGAVFSEGEWFSEGKKYEEPDLTVPFPTESESARRRRLRSGGTTVLKG